ncbi:hypothetical protein [Maritimibacter sp. DP1N21-5]|uniref:hypothetical protein n=1 Tax=Maritimibacter sp. DP1N21-5 TaxID=2836867 RepID=UPI001C47759F|nr:hypothetical protein [Maritimibacter sp. DP1N21-5]MBV7410893.1 hypothetical protein [Maritimibacter sp. DP1N21-5]
MPLPLVPIAIAAVTYGSVVYTAYRTVKKVAPGRRCQKAEDGLDRLDEGMTYRREPEQANATARLKRTFTFGETSYEIDAAALGRLKVRKL